MTSRSRNAGALVLLLAAVLPACDIRNPTENVDVRLNLTAARVELGAIGAVPLVPGQATERSSLISAGISVISLEAVQAIRLQPSFLTYSPAAAGSAQGAAGGTAAAAAASGTVLVALRSGNRPLLAAIVTVTDNVVTAIDPSVATLDVAVARIREHAVTAGQHVPGAGASLGQWETLTTGGLLATLESILAAQQSGVTLVVLPLTGNLSGSLRLAEFTVDATVTARR